MTVESGGNVFGLIERQRNTGRFVGKIIGFPHVEFSGSSLAEVEAKLRGTALDYLASGVLALETQFVALVHLHAAAANTESTPPPTQPDTPPRVGSHDAGSSAADLDARLQPLLHAFKPDVHGGEYAYVVSPITGKIKTFGPVGPPYEIGRPLRQLDNGDWLFEVTMIETGERAEYRLGQIVDDPDAG